ncbi:MAG TPA: hypothetical protein VK149_09555 [Sideroxyarcus sp.]|nr:hypothetical protein [Sideroxyarcus sp.]
MMKKISIQLNGPRMLSGHSLTFIPLVAMYYGYADSIVYLQLRYLASTSKYEIGKIRISYTKLHEKHFPFYSRRWVMEAIDRLERAELIVVHRTGRVNVFEVNPLPDEDCQNILPVYGPHTSGDEPLSDVSSLVSPMQVSVALAEKAGLLEAIAIQQIHLRHRHADGSHWVLRTFVDWHEDVFMFLSLSTVKRLFARLEKRGLIFVGKYIGEYGVLNCYRVNYSRIAEVLGIELPESVAPLAKYAWDNQQKWVSQTHPVKYKQKNDATNDCISLVH